MAQFPLLSSLCSPFSLNLFLHTHIHTHTHTHTHALPSLVLFIAAMADDDDFPGLRRKVFHNPLFEDTEGPPLSPSLPLSLWCIGSSESVVCVCMSVCV